MSTTETGNKSPSRPTGDDNSSGQTGSNTSSGQTETEKTSTQTKTNIPSAQRPTGSIILAGQAESSNLSGQADSSNPIAKAHRRSKRKTDRNSSRIQADSNSSKYQSGSNRPCEQGSSRGSIGTAPQFSLSRFIDVKQLLNIGYRNPEFLPLIKRVSVVGDIMSNFRTQVQIQIVELIMNIDRTIRVLVYMKNKSYNADDAYRLLPHLSNELCRVVLQQGCYILDPAVRNFIEWNNISAKLDKKKRSKKSCNDLFDMSTRFYTKDLIKIAHNHPEFSLNIKTILRVNSAMKHLAHDGQVEIFRILRRIENIIKELVEEKINPGGCHDIFLTPETLISSVEDCIEKILKHLKTLPKKGAHCSQCEIDREYVRNVSIQPELGTFRRPRRKQQLIPRQNLKSEFECANWGISQYSVKNLESLFHHLASKSGANKHVWTFETNIDWFEIASLYTEYREKTLGDLSSLQIVKRHMLRKLNEVDNVMVGARAFCGRLRAVSFTRNETLSDTIALSGQLDMIVSEVEDYLSKIDGLIRHVLGYPKHYMMLSRTIRANRFLFLTKTHRTGFNFPPK